VCCVLCRDADETKAWINEKDTALSTDDYGRDLAGVQALQRRHDGLERDLAALEDKVMPVQGPFAICWSLVTCTIHSPWYQLEGVG